MDIATLDTLRIVLDPAGQAGVGLALMLVMFSVALGLKVDDFRYLLERRGLFAGGVVTQVVGLPLVTFGLVALLAPPPSLALGMFVVACCPGGAASNLMTWLARGNVVYSVSLTAVSSLLAAFATPVSILFWSGVYGPTADLLDALGFSPLAFLARTTLLLAVPLVAGMLVQARAPDVAVRLRRRMALAGVLALGSVIAYGIWHFFPVLAPALPLLAGLGILHNALAFGTGLGAAALLRADRPARRALTFEIGIQNSGLAIVILIAQFEGLGGAAAIAAFWGVWHLVAGGLIVVLYRYGDAKARG
ncbi:MAG: bile acid:sodium symporter [Woeseiaceae bacterium]|nr:bile acid:sodium symporter [Woeseiaceae bacterium]